MGMRWPFIAFVVGVLAQGCQQTDAAGVKSVGVADLPELRVVESAAIGGSGAEGEDALGWVRSAAFLAGDAVVALADGTVQQIHFFTVDGRHVGKVGGRGGGPGEFLALGQVSGLADGRLAAWDVQQSRVTYFSPLRTVSGAFRADLEPVRAMLPELVGFLPDGGYVLRDIRDEMGMREVPEGIVDDTVRLYHYSAHGALQDTIAVLRNEPRWFRNRDRSWGRVDLIFGRALTSVVVGEEVWVGSTGRMSFTRYSLRGAVLGQTDVPWALRLASQADIEAERLRRAAGVRPAGRVRAFTRDALGNLIDLSARMAATERESIQEVASNDTIPAYDLAVSGPPRALWVREYPRPQDTTVTWIRLDSIGRPQGVVRLGRNAELKAATADWLAVLERDAYDAPVVRLLRVVLEPPHAS